MIMLWSTENAKRILKGLEKNLNIASAISNQFVVKLYIKNIPLFTIPWYLGYKFVMYYSIC